jgi:hypothetical protein
MEQIITVRNSNWTLEQLLDKAKKTRYCGLKYNDLNHTITKHNTRLSPTTYNLEILDHQNILIKQIPNKHLTPNKIVTSLVLLLMTILVLTGGLDSHRIIIILILWAVPILFNILFNLLNIQLVRTTIQKYFN